MAVMGASLNGSMTDFPESRGKFMVVNLGDGGSHESYD